MWLFAPEGRRLVATSEARRATPADAKLVVRSADRPVHGLRLGCARGYMPAPRWGESYGTRTRTVSSFMLNTRQLELAARDGWIVTSQADCVVVRASSRDVPAALASAVFLACFAWFAVVALEQLRDHFSVFDMIFLAVAAAGTGSFLLLLLTHSFGRVEAVFGQEGLTFSTSAWPLRRSWQESWADVRSLEERQRRRKSGQSEDWVLKGRRVRRLDAGDELRTEALVELIALSTGILPMRSK